MNPVAKLDRYPIPKVKDLLARLANGKSFTKIDLSHAYHQLPLVETLKQYVVINTHKGLFQYTRLPFGISSTPGIFQRVIESIIQGIPGVVAYLDDILMTGPSEEAHLTALKEVLSRLEDAGLRAKKDKCEFMVPSVTYLDHKIATEGIHLLPEKVEAIRDAPRPTCVTELKAYLGILTYYSKFLPNMSTVLAPLDELLQKVSVEIGQRTGESISRVQETVHLISVACALQPSVEGDAGVCLWCCRSACSPDAGWDGKAYRICFTIVLEI